MNTDTPSACPSRHRRLGVRLAAVSLGAGALLAVPGVASAHVTIQPSSIEGGGFSVVSVRVPNERDDASTTKVRVILPVDQPLGSVQTTPVPGWRVATAEREDRKSTRLNSSHANNSYAVFCLEKKTA